MRIRDELTEINAAYYALVDSGAVLERENDDCPASIANKIHNMMRRVQLPETTNPIVRHIKRTGFTC